MVTDLGKIGQQMNAAARSATLSMAAIGKVMKRVGEQFHRWATSVCWAGPRCPICYPRANPRPLCIDGHAYRRKRNHR